MTGFRIFRQNANTSDSHLARLIRYYIKQVTWLSFMPCLAQLQLSRDGYPERCASRLHFTGLAGLVTPRRYSLASVWVAPCRKPGAGGEAAEPQVRI